MTNKIETILNVLGDYIEHLEQGLNAYQEAYRKAVDENNALKQRVEEGKKEKNVVPNDAKKPK